MSQTSFPQNAGWRKRFELFVRRIPKILQLLRRADARDWAIVARRTASNGHNGNGEEVKK
jgi:hypothetical protein